VISQGCVSVIQLVIVYLLLCKKKMYPDKLNEMFVLQFVMTLTCTSFVPVQVS